MAEKRSHPRIRRRFVLKYGEHTLDRNGFTADISKTGMFVMASSMPPIDARVHVQLFVDEARSVYFEGSVRRHRLIPPALRQVQRGGFGLRLLRPEEIYAELFEKAAELGESKRLQLHVGTIEELKRLYEQELRHGMLFVPTREPLPRDAFAEIEIVIAFGAPIVTVSCPGKVVHVVQDASRNDGTQAGLGFELLEREASLSQIEQRLRKPA